MEENTNMSEVIEEIKGASEEELKKVIEEHFDAVRTQGMKLGATYVASAVYGALEKHIGRTTKPSLRDYQRAVKRIVEIVYVQLGENNTRQNDLTEVEQGGDAQ